MKDGRQVKIKKNIIKNFYFSIRKIKKEDY